MRLCPSERPAENIYSKGGFTQIGGQWWTIKTRNQPKRSIRQTPGHSWACRTCRWTSTTTKHYHILDIWPFEMMHNIFKSYALHVFWRSSPLQRLLPGQARRRLWRKRGPSRGQRRWSSGSKKCVISKSFHKNYFSMNPKISIIQKDYSLDPHPRKVHVPIFFPHTLSSTPPINSAFKPASKSSPCSGHTWRTGNWSLDRQDHTSKKIKIRWRTKLANSFLLSCVGYNLLSMSSNWSWSCLVKFLRHADVAFFTDLSLIDLSNSASSAEISWSKWLILWY